MAEMLGVDVDPRSGKSSFVDGIPGSRCGESELPLSDRVTVEIIDDLQELESREAEWSDLSENASEPNVFYEPWMLLPALRAFGVGRGISCALVYRESSRRDAAPHLCGLVPLERRRVSSQVPVSAVSAWTHDYCFQSTPLLRHGHEAACLEALFRELSRGRAAPSLIEFPYLLGEGVMESAVDDVLASHQAAFFEVSRHGRALLDARGDWQDSVARALSNRHRSELRRQRRRLAEKGDVTLRIISDAAHCGFWVDQFLELEASGWKGRSATAIKQDPAHARFFKEMIQGAAAQNKLMLLGLFLNNEPIALKCNLVSGGGAFAFKIAYDESLEKLSPGMHLEIENIRVACEHPEIEWVDSCAAPRHPMINRLWRGRRAMRHLVVSTGRWSGDAAVGLWPVVRTLRRRIRRGARPFSIPATD